MRLRLHSKPVFDSILEELGRGLQIADEAVGRSFTPGASRQDLSWTLTFARSDAVPDHSRPRMGALYDTTDVITPPAPLSLDKGQISRDVGLTANLNPDEVATLRRQFALRNHPDRVAVDLRELATQRMMIANALCDHYLKVNKPKP